MPLRLRWRAASQQVGRESSPADALPQGNTGDVVCATSRFRTASPSDVVGHAVERLHGERIEADRTESGPHRALDHMAVALVSRRPNVALGRLQPLIEQQTTVRLLLDALPAASRSAASESTASFFLPRTSLSASTGRRTHLDQPATRIPLGDASLMPSPPTLVCHAAERKTCISLHPTYARVPSEDFGKGL